MKILSLLFTSIISQSKAATTWIYHSNIPNVQWYRCGAYESKTGTTLNTCKNFCASKKLSICQYDITSAN